MSAILLAVVIALVLGHTVPAVRAWRDVGWYLAWIEWLGERRGSTSAWGFVLVLLPPLLLVALLQGWLGAVGLGIPGFVFAVLVLVYSWGPGDLDADVEAVLDAADTPSRERALVDAVLQAALRRWFGVLLWFLVLGPVGALAYRLLVVGAQGPGRPLLSPRECELASALLRVADWPVAQLMTLGLALVGDFDRVLGAWRDWHARGASLDSGFLQAAGRACVDAELADEPVEMFEDSAPTDWGPGDAALRDAMSLCWRVLLLWLVVLALFVLAGYVN